jgi:hypothetical protein
VCGAVSFSYCIECLSANREPYSALVGIGLLATEMSEAFKEEVLLPNLKFHNKTTEQFDKDVQALNDDYRRSMLNILRRNNIETETEM